MKKLILIVCLLFMTSCAVTKSKSDKQSDKKTEEVIEKSTKRKGDTVTFVIPNIKVKDTTIYTVNRQGSTIRTVYDQQGQVSQIDCFTSMIEQMERSNKLIVESAAERSKDKKEEVSSLVVLYIVLGIVIVLIVFMYMVLKKISILTIPSKPPL